MERCSSVFILLYFSSVYENAAQVGINSGATEYLQEPDIHTQSLKTAAKQVENETVVRLLALNDEAQTEEAEIENKETTLITRGLEGFFDFARSWYCRLRYMNQASPAPVVSAMHMMEPNPAIKTVVMKAPTTSTMQVVRGQQPPPDDRERQKAQRIADLKKQQPQAAGAPVSRNTARPQTSHGRTTPSPSPTISGKKSGKVVPDKKAVPPASAPKTRPSPPPPKGGHQYRAPPPLAQKPKDPKAMTSQSPPVAEPRTSDELGAKLYGGRWSQVKRTGTPEWVPQTYDAKTSTKGWSVHPLAGPQSLPQLPRQNRAQFPQVELAKSWVDNVRSVTDGPLRQPGPP